MALALVGKFDQKQISTREPWSIHLLLHICPLVIEPKTFCTTRVGTKVGVEVGIDVEVGGGGVAVSKTNESLFFLMGVTVGSVVAVSVGAGVAGAVSVEVVITPITATTLGVGKTVVALI